MKVFVLTMEPYHDNSELLGVFAKRDDAVDAAHVDLKKREEKVIYRAKRAGIDWDGDDGFVLKGEDGTRCYGDDYHIHEEDVL